MAVKRIPGLQAEIEARKEAERKLRGLMESERLASEEKLRAFFEAAPQAILAMSRDGCIRLVNRRTEEMFGRSRADLLGQPAEILIPERFHAAHRAGREEFFANPRGSVLGVDRELMGLGADGVEFPIEISISFVQQPEADLALALVTDVSERRKNDAAVRASEAKLRSFLEAASQGILAVDARGRIQVVNRRTEEMFGYTREELLGQELEILLPERYRSAHVGHRAGYFSEPRIRSMGAGLDLAGRRKDGTEFPIEIGLSYVQNEGGTLALGLVSDITARKHSEDALEYANAELQVREGQLSAYLEAAPQAILAVDMAHNIALVNRVTEEMFGYRREELLGRPLAMLIPDRFRALHHKYETGYFAAPWHRRMDSGLTLSGRRKDGTEFPIEVALNHVETGRGRLALGMVSDITARKLAEEELARVHAELRRTNQDLEQFSYAASHDLQEPVRMITNYLQLLKRRAGTKLDEEDLEFLHYATDGAARMMTLIQDMLRLAHAGRQTLKLVPVAAARVLETARGSLMASIEESGASVTAGPLPEIVADGSLLTQVFQNLIGNAIKFQKPGSRPEIHVTARQHGFEWVFGVRDNGIGIEPHHRDRIFQMFERLHGTSEFGGSGVGLAISHRIVERHGGRIWVESEPGLGSTFYFTIPLQARGATGSG